MDLHGSGVGIIENGASWLWLKDGCVGAGGVNPSLVCFRSMYWLDANTRAAHLDPSMDVEKPRHANTQQHVSGPFSYTSVSLTNRNAVAGRGVSEFFIDEAVLEADPPRTIESSVGFA